jgi:hydrogenase maturation factor
MRVAKYIRLVFSFCVLIHMMRDATGGGLGGVQFEDFEGVMRRAGVFT